MLISGCTGDGGREEIPACWQKQWWWWVWKLTDSIGSPTISSSSRLANLCSSSSAATLFITGKAKSLPPMLIGRVVTTWAWVPGRVCNCSGIETPGLIWTGTVWFARFWARIFPEAVLLAAVSIAWLLPAEIAEFDPANPVEMNY